MRVTGEVIPVTGDVIRVIVDGMRPIFPHNAIV